MLAHKQYELTNHLGNVLAVITDKKTPVFNTSNVITHYKADVIAAYDYYPFGSIMRKWLTPENSGNNLRKEYLFGFGGSEKDDEIYSTGRMYTAEFWEYDAALARRWNVDPVRKHHESPYAAFGNNPIWFVDPNGADTSFADNQARTDFNATYSGVSNAMKNVQGQIDALKQKAQNKGWSDKKLARKTESLTNRLNDLNKVKTAFDEIIKSSTMFIYSTDVSKLKDADGHTTQTGENEVSIVFKPGMQGVIVHESRHGYGFILKEWKGGSYGALQGYDLEDERQGFLYQMIWDAAAVQKKIETAAQNIYPSHPELQPGVTLNDMIMKYYGKDVQYKEFKQHYVE